MRAILLLGILTAITLKSSAQDLSALYEKVDPAVVVIMSEAQDVAVEGGQVRKVSKVGLGSGFMISNNQIITAAHVVTVAEKIKVEFVDGEVIPARVVSSYKSADVALLQLSWPKTDATTVSLADSDKLKVGERVFVIGAPFGLAHSLSSGYVSSVVKNTESHNPFTDMEFIQTDAAINTGNSGGPMFNLKGEVVGVVSQILTQSGGFEGIGFAATSNVAQRLLLDQQLFWTGMDLVTLTGELAQAFNIGQESGLLVQRVAKSSASDLMGVKGGSIEAKIGDNRVLLGGDIILSINEIQFELKDEVLNEIFQRTEERGDRSFTLEVLRAGQRMTLELD